MLLVVIFGTFLSCRSTNVEVRRLYSIFYLVSSESFFSEIHSTETFEQNNRNSTRSHFKANSCSKVHNAHIKLASPILREDRRKSALDLQQVFTETALPLCPKWTVLKRLKQNNRNSTTPSFFRANYCLKVLNVHTYKVAFVTFR